MPMTPEEHAKVILGDSHSTSLERKNALFLLGDVIIQKLHIVSDDNNIYLYKDGVYESGGDEKIKDYVRVELDFKGEVLERDLTELVTYIKRHTKKEIKEPIDKICVENGILDIKTMKVTPHTPDIIFLNKINAKYEPNAKCPNNIKFLLEVVDKESIPVLQEYIGYLLLKNQDYAKALMLYGTGSNGKSVFINVLKNFLGEGNYTSFSLQELESVPFIRNELKGKLANLFADLPKSAMKDTSIFKSLTGSDSIHTRKKFIQKTEEIKSYAKMIYSANQIPKPTNDMTYAFFRRWIIVIFPHEFKGKNKNPHLLKQLTTPEELSGLLNFAIDGLKRLEGQKGFTDRSEEETERLFLRYSDSVHSFVEDMLEEDIDAWELKDKLYSAYINYWRKNRMVIKTNNAFHRDLIKVVNVENYKPTIGRKQQHAWKGIKLLSKPRQEFSKKHGYHGYLGKKVRKYIRKLHKYTLNHTETVNIDSFNKISMLSMKFLCRVLGNRKIKKEVEKNMDKVDIFSNVKKNKTKASLLTDMQILRDLKAWEKPDELGVVSAQIIFSNPNQLGWQEDKLNHFNNMVKRGVFREIRPGFYFSEQLRDFAPDSEAPSEENEGKKEV